MRLAPCDEWVTVEQIEADPRFCPPGEDVPEPDLEGFAQRATEAMWVLTGRRFGVCTATVRPRRCGPVCGCSCGCEGGIPLHYPVISIDSVKVSGVTVPHYLIDGYLLHRKDGKPWPTTQSLALDDDEVGAFAITYTYGVPAPPTVIKGAVELAVQFYLQDIKSPYCQLPFGTSKVTRQGMTLDMEKALESSNRFIQDAINLYPMGMGLPSDVMTTGGWELLIRSA